VGLKEKMHIATECLRRGLGGIPGK